MFRRFIQIFLLKIFIVVGISLFSNGQDLGVLKFIVPTINLSSDCKDTYLTPKNDFCSIVYLLFTRANQRSPCYFEPNVDEFKCCDFDPSLETKVLIHGFLVQLKPGNLFELIKDALLSKANYNVIIVDWTRYNDLSYEQAVFNAQIVAVEVSKLISFLMKEEVDAEDIHFIGHSLGAHISGIAARKFPNVGRITGLDPAFPLFETDISDRLRYDDAIFVDVIHCSNGQKAKGFGISSPIGFINFYPNGGDNQPACRIGKNFTTGSGEMKQIKSKLDKVCRHDICISYFLYSIQRCDFPSTECDSYRRYKMGQCSWKSHPEVSMGLPARKVAGVASQSKFYLKTDKSAPFCLKKAENRGDF